MVRRRLILLMVIPLLVCFCAKVDPVIDAPGEDTPEPPLPPEVFTLDCVPVLKVTTAGGVEISSRYDYFEGGTFTLEYSETSSRTGESVPRVVEFGEFDIKGRGNSTWHYPKKPYTVKFDEKQEILWMGKGRSWVLLANWMDKTLLRNDVAFEISSRCSGLAWAPKGEFVELWLNGRDMGLYYLCPHISINGDRVDIGDDGVIFELDTYYDETYKFKSAIGLPVMIKDFEVGEGEPEGVLPTARFNQIKNKFLAAEATVKNAAACQQENYPASYDVASMIDFLFVNELVINGELGHPKSTYMYYDPSDALYHFGPVWDFDWATFRLGVRGIVDKDTLWYRYLFKDPLFVSTLKERWALLKPSLETMPEYIAERYNWIKDYAEANFVMWPIKGSDVNGDENLSYEKAVSRMKDALKERISALDGAISVL